MRINELVANQQESHSQALNARIAQIWTSIPGIIQSFNHVNQTVVVQPAIKMLRFDQNGTASNDQLPLLVDCPVQFPRGGGYTLTFPVAAGDECLIVFANRCIDAWWESGGVSNQAVMRMHDLSDGFALLGFSSVPNVIPAISTTAAQLRSNDGLTFVEVGASEITLNAATVNITGAVNITGNVATTGTLKNNGHDVGSTHQHINSGGTGLGGVPQ